MSIWTPLDRRRLRKPAGQRLCVSSSACTLLDGPFADTNARIAPTGSGK
jgi:hypothetical protein